MHQVVDQTYLRWTEDRPLEPGTYWVRVTTHYGRFQMVTLANVERSHAVRPECAIDEPWDGLHFRLWEVPAWHLKRWKESGITKEDYSGWVHYGGKNMGDTLEWAGPIPEPR